MIGDTYTFSPTTVLDLRLSYLREYYDDKQPSAGLDLSVFGPAWATLQNKLAYTAAPGIGFTGANSLSGFKGQFSQSPGGSTSTLSRPA